MFDIKIGGDWRNISSVGAQDIEKNIIFLSVIF